MLAEELKDRALRRSYDVVLIDCAPNLNVLNKAALVAGDWVLIPAKADHLSTLGMSTSSSTFTTWLRLTDSAPCEVARRGAIPTNLSGSTWRGLLDGS